MEAEGTRMATTADEILSKILHVDKPWGNFEQYAHNQLCTVKILTVEANQVLSKQLHQSRDELWIVVDPGLKIELDDAELLPQPYDRIVIPRKTKHRLASTGARGRVLEISFGYFDEDDVERFEDIYGRV